MENLEAVEEISCEPAPAEKAAVSAARAAKRLARVPMDIKSPRTSLSLPATHENTEEWREKRSPPLEFLLASPQNEEENLG